MLINCTIMSLKSLIIWIRWSLWRHLQNRLLTLPRTPLDAKPLLRTTIQRLRISTLQWQKLPRLTSRLPKIGQSPNQQDSYEMLSQGFSKTPFKILMICSRRDVTGIQIFILLSLLHHADILHKLITAYRLLGFGTLSFTLYETRPMPIRESFLARSFIKTRLSMLFPCSLRHSLNPKILRLVQKNAYRGWTLWWTNMHHLGPIQGVCLRLRLIPSSSRVVLGRWVSNFSPRSWKALRWLEYMP